MKLLLLISLLCSFTIYGQNAKTIVWSQNTSLKFVDFCGHPDSMSKYGAISFFDYNDSYIIDYDTLEYEIFAFFCADKSWIKMNDSDLLFHEQLHFSIAEICNRTIKKKLSMLANKKVDDSVILNIFSVEVANQNTIDSIFDFETQHGTSVAKTKIWSEKIQKMLDSLNEFKYPTGKVPILPRE